MFDRLFHNAFDRYGNALRLAVQDGRIARLASTGEALPAAETVDLGGRLVLPGFVDGHIPLDKSFVGDR